VSHTTPAQEKFFCPGLNIRKKCPFRPVVTFFSKFEKNGKNGKKEEKREKNLKKENTKKSAAWSADRGEKK
jgi:hypothetical protein